MRIGGIFFTFSNKRPVRLFGTLEYINFFYTQNDFSTQHVLPHVLQKEELLTKIYLYAIFVYSIIPHLKWIGIGTFEPWSESLDIRLIELPELFRLFFVDLFTFPNFFSFKLFLILANLASRVRLPKYPGKLLLCSTRFFKTLVFPAILFLSELVLLSLLEPDVRLEFSELFRLFSTHFPTISFLLDTIELTEFSANPKKVPLVGARTFDTLDKISSVVEF